MVDGHFSALIFVVGRLNQLGDWMNHLWRRSAFLMMVFF